MNSIERGLLFVLAGVVVFDHVGTARAGGDARVYAGTEFTLLTDQGRTVGSFRISPEGLPELVMADGKGHGRILIGVKGADDAIIGITDSAGEVRAALIGDAEGQHSLQLTDAAMVPRLDLAVTAKGAPRISVISAKNKELIGLGIDAGEGPRLSLTNETGDSRLQCGTGITPDAFGLYLFGKGPTPRTGFEIDNSNASHVFAQDLTAKGRAELEAPSDAPPGVSVRDKTGKKVPIK